MPNSLDDLPSGDLLWGQIYDESDPPTVIIDSGNYDPSLSVAYFSHLVNQQLGLNITPEDVLVGKSKTASFSGDIALYNGEILPITSEISTKTWNFHTSAQYFRERGAKIVDLTQKIDYKRQKMANILDPVHETLDQDVFNGTNPDLPIFKAHIHKIKRIFKERGYNPDDFDFYFTGSLCTYQYHETSDVDISITPKNEWFSDEERSYLISIIVNELDGEQFRGTLHEYQHYLQPNGVNIYDLFAVGMRAGYDILAEKWVKKPDRMKAVDIEKAHPDWISEAVQVSDKINSLLDEGYDEEAQLVYEDIHRARRDDQLLMGDESPGNVIYKFLEGNGTFNKLRLLKSGEYHGI